MGNQPSAPHQRDCSFPNLDPPPRQLQQQLKKPSFRRPAAPTPSEWAVVGSEPRRAHLPLSVLEEHASGGGSAARELALPAIASAADAAAAELAAAEALFGISRGAYVDMTAVAAMQAGVARGYPRGTAAYGPAVMRRIQRRGVASHGGRGGDRGGEEEERVVEVEVEERREGKGGEPKSGGRDVLAEQEAGLSPAVLAAENAELAAERTAAEHSHARGARQEAAAAAERKEAEEAAAERKEEKAAAAMREKEEEEAMKKQEEEAMRKKQEEEAMRKKQEEEAAARAAAEHEAARNAAEAEMMERLAAVEAAAAARAAAVEAAAAARAREEEERVLAAAGRQAAAEVVVRAITRAQSEIVSQALAEAAAEAERWRRGESRGEPRDGGVADGTKESTAAVPVATGLVAKAAREEPVNGVRAAGAVVNGVRGPAGTKATPPSLSSRARSASTSVLPRPSPSTRVGSWSHYGPASTPLPPQPSDTATSCGAWEARARSAEREGISHNVSRMQQSPRDSWQPQREPALDPSVCRTQQEWLEKQVILNDSDPEYRAPDSPTGPEESKREQTYTPTVPARRAHSMGGSLPSMAHSLSCELDPTYLHIDANMPPSSLLDAIDQAAMREAPKKKLINPSERQGPRFTSLPSMGHKQRVPPLISAGVRPRMQRATSGTGWTQQTRSVRD
ncbi:hypothetical protein AB1Y20_013323 [Prymnesium parvum]|uniref:Uncharacterized protein n=1 Tax=Prymnesium parvum TaxID=97485 RepID=A0AB34IMW3_PRYPA